MPMLNHIASFVWGLFMAALALTKSCSLVMVLCAVNMRAGSCTEGEA